MPKKSARPSKNEISNPHHHLTQKDQIMKSFLKSLIVFVFVSVFSVSVSFGALTLKVQEIPESGLVMARVPARVLAFLLERDPQTVQNIRVRLGETAIQAQYAGETLVFQCDENLIARSKDQVLEFTLEPVVSDPAVRGPEQVAAFQVENSEFRITHEAAKRGAFPSRVEFLKTGRVMDSLAFHDRLYADGKQWGVNLDPAPVLEVLSDGPICTVVRTHGFYSINGKASESGTNAVYEWFYFKTVPGLIYVKAVARQERPREWKEAHFLEIHPNDPGFTEWAGLNAPKGSKDSAEFKTGTFTGADEQKHFSQFGGISDGKNFLMLSAGSGAYDGLGHYGPYLHADLYQAWATWDSPRKFWAAWMAVRTFDSPADFEAFGRKFFVKPSPAYVKLEISGEIPALADAKEPWRKALAEALLLGEKEFTSAEFQALKTGTNAPVERIGSELVLVKSRDLAALLEQKTDSVRLIALVDRNSGTCFTAADPEPIFQLDFRRVFKPEEGTETSEKFQKLSVSSDSGWKSVDFAPTEGGVQFRFSGPKVRGLEDAQIPVEVTLQLLADPEKDGLRLTWSGKSGSDEYTLMEFWPGMVTCGEFGPRVTAIYPASSGHLVRRAPQSTVNYRSGYPSGWAVMPWFAAWDEESGAGLYLGVHDPDGSQKELRMNAIPGKSAFQMAFLFPIANQTLPGNSFSAPGEVVLRSFRGDWVDAASIYRDWVRTGAKWFPTLDENGRPDTPQCMKELCIWAQDGGAPGSMVERTRDFQAAFGVPAAVHWYSWHKTPFDNDYPHYVPLDGFREAVEKIQSENQTIVMPYINGRLWDSRDRGLEDFQFTSVALPAVTKKEDGEPFFETYHSKESDGSPVKLGVMCPSTELWRNKMHATVAGLMNNQSVKGVYMDQIAAAKPALCMDPTHGHTLGGGSWWRESYEKMLTEIRSDVQKNGTPASPAAERFITSECNSEIYTNRLDGLLTWHVQDDDCVPAFAFVYGGAIQCFGRNYGGCSDQAFRMKAAQQLVFGEQIGWFSLSTVKREDLMKYLRPLVRFRTQIQPYFWRGEMARPAKFLAELPKITDDWNWHGPTPVTMEALQTGTWRIVAYPTDQQTWKRDWNSGKTEKAVVIFTNFSTEPVKSRVSLNVQELGFPEGAKLRFEKIDSEGTRTPLPADFLNGEITFPALETWGVEISGE